MNTQNSIRMIQESTQRGLEEVQESTQRDVEEEPVSGDIMAQVQALANAIKVQSQDELIEDSAQVENE